MADLIVVLKNRTHVKTDPFVGAENKTDPIAVSKRTGPCDKGSTKKTHVDRISAINSAVTAPPHRQQHQHDNTKQKDSWFTTLWVELKDRLARSTPIAESTKTIHELANIGSTSVAASSHEQKEPAAPSCHRRLTSAKSYSILATKHTPGHSKST